MPDKLRELYRFTYGSERHFVVWKRLSPDPLDFGYRVTDLRTGEQIDFRGTLDEVAYELGYDSIKIKEGPDGLSPQFLFQQSNAS